MLRWMSRCWGFTITMCQRMIDFFVNPDIALLRKSVVAVNEGIQAGVWPFLARNHSFERNVAEAWLAAQDALCEVRVVGVNALGCPVVVSYLARNHGRSFHSARFAITVHPSVEGKGHAHEAFCLLAKSAKAIGVKRIEALPVISNVRAVRFLLRHGFLKEGVAERRFMTDDGRYEDCIYMAATFFD